MAGEPHRLIARAQFGQGVLDLREDRLEGFGEAVVHVAGPGRAGPRGSGGVREPVADLLRLRAAKGGDDHVVARGGERLGVLQGKRRGEPRPVMTHLVKAPGACLRLDGGFVLVGQIRCLGQPVGHGQAVAGGGVVIDRGRCGHEAVPSLGSAAVPCRAPVWPARGGLLTCHSLDLCATPADLTHCSLFRAMRRPPRGPYMPPPAAQAGGPGAVGPGHTTTPGTMRHPA